MGRYTGPRGWSCFEWIKCEFKFLKCRLCPSSWIVLPCLLVHLVSTSQSPHPTCLLPSTNCKKTMNLCQLRKFTPQGRKRPWFWGEKNKTKKKKSCEDVVHFLFPGIKWFIKGQLIPCTCPEHWFNFFCICMNYTLCASLLCENSKRWNKNKRQQKALQRIWKKKKKKAVRRWNSDHIIWVACSFV